LESTPGRANYCVIDCTGRNYFLKAPCSINIPDNEKIIGHNLNGIKSILKPVNNDNIAMENNIIEDAM
jgi:hypothetical protein